MARERAAVLQESHPNPLESEAEKLALEAAARGDYGPVGEVLEVYRKRLKHLLRLRLSPKLFARLDASDILQDTYMEVTHRLPEYLRNRESVEPQRAMPFFLWVRFLTGQKLQQLHRFHLGTAKRDAALDHAQVIAGYPAASSENLVNAIAAQDLSPSAVYSQEEARELLAEALESLSAQDREVLMLRHFEHLSNREIAHLLELTDAGASLRHLRALERLRSALGTKGFPFSD